MSSFAQGETLADRDVPARAAIAARVGTLLAADDLPAVERRAAEILARELVQDAIERVRRALAEAVAHASLLPKDVALRIAHDLDSVACPFLRQTEVFSEDEWHQLVLTISRGGRIAVASRKSLSEGLALELAELGDSVVAEALVDNSTAPMTPIVCRAVIERSGHAQWVLEKLADRDGLNAEIVIRLIQKVSVTVAEKLAKTYGISANTRPIVLTAAQEAILQVLRDIPESELLARAVRLRKQQVLTGAFLLRALRDDAFAFFVAALSVLSAQRPERVRTIVLHESGEIVLKLLTAARIDSNLHDAFWSSIETLRESRNHLDR